MLNPIIISRYNVGYKILPYTVLKKILNRKYASLNVDEVKEQLYSKREPSDKVNIILQKQNVLLRACTENITAIKEILKKHNVEMSELSTLKGKNTLQESPKKHNVKITDISILKDKNILQESPWTIEKRIMLLQEFGIPQVKLKYILSFPKAIYLSTKMYKAYTLLDANANLAKNMLAYVKNSNVDFKMLTHLHDDLKLKVYYNECFIHYIKKELELSDDDSNLKKMYVKKFSALVYNSFRLIQRLLILLRNELKFSNEFIAENVWLLGIHPGQAETIVNKIKTQLPGISLNIISKCPRVLEYDTEDFQILLSYFKHYEITTKMIENSPNIFQLTSEEFKRRIDNLLEIPFTLVLKKHTKFLTLVRKYHIILPRLRYLEENNYKFATINSLTSFHNYVEELVSSKKMNTSNLKSFFESQFAEEDAPKLLDRLSSHPYYRFVSLVQMYETLMYLRQNFSEEVIYKHIYAILYNRDNLQAAYEEVLNDPKYNHWTPTKLLALTVYKLEIKTHFTGEGVFFSEKNKSENLNEDMNINEEEKNESIISKFFQGKIFTKYKKSLYQFLINPLNDKNDSTKKKKDE